MQHSHNAIHTYFEVCPFSRRVLEAFLLKPGLSAIVYPQLTTLSENRPTHLSHFPQTPSFGTTSRTFRTIGRNADCARNALANLARVAAEAVPGKTGPIQAGVKPIGKIADVNLNAPQSNREVTKTNAEKTPYPEPQSIRENRGVWPRSISRPRHPLV